MQEKMTLKEFYKKHSKDIDIAVKSALAEDKVKDDITTNLLFGKKITGKPITAKILCKEDCILAGVEIFQKVFKTLYSKTTFKNYSGDGQKIRNNSVVLEVKAPLTILLEGERTALNFLQRMSGIATLTNEFVRKLRFKNAKILHTRKTTPGFRLFELAAVKTGGGDFHRFDLSSSVMIKDNHIEAVGSIDRVLDALKNIRLSKKQKHRFEIEVKGIEELSEVLKKARNTVKIVMLDNFPTDDIPKALVMLNNSGIKTELSGGIRLDNFEQLQQEGIDYYSVGMLTHSYKSIDFSLEF